MSRRRFAGASRGGTFVIVAMLFLGSVLLVAEMTSAAAVTVPYSTAAVADPDLDGDPATGDWGGASSTAVPLENGQGGGYGTGTLYAKHDGAVAYFRIDGQVDVPWASAGGNHFWLGWQVSPADTAHHGGGTWDGAFFGLWDGTDYAPMPTYPPAAVDTYGFDRPPLQDGSQNLLGRLRYSGGAAPYAYTAEWKKALNTGDADDLTYAADGTTVYNFFVTTDSNGGGSGGGGIGHRGTTNTNTLVLAAPPANTPPTADLTDPDGGEDWTGGSVHKVWWNMSDAQTSTPALLVWINYSTNGGGSYSPVAGAQGVSGFTNPASYDWTLPSVTTAQARVRITVRDGGGLTASDPSAADFVIDSTPPSVTGITPANNSVGNPVTTWVNVTFSEAMNAPATEGAASLWRLPAWSPVALTVQGWVGTTLRLQPSAVLQPGTTYAVNVTSAARDDSSPGNALPIFSSGFTTALGSTPPTGAIAMPDGLQDWTGGTSHAVVWDMADGQTPAPGLTAWLNYSYNAGTLTGAIAGPVAGSANPHSAPWSVPAVDATDMTVNLTVIDGDGMRAWDDALVPVVDSTPPSVTATNPPDAAVNVPVSTAIDVTFSEPMGRPATEAAVTLYALPGWTPVPLSVQGWAGPVLTVLPVSPLASRTVHALNVSAAATDDSSPGNALAAFTLQFTTEDLPPSAAVASPSGGERWTGGSLHPITWSASDVDTPVGQLNVSLWYSLTGAAPWSPIAWGLSGPSGTTPWTLPVADSVTAAVRATAVDTSGGGGEGISPAFAIDSTPPAVTARSPGPGQTGIPLNANVLVTFSEAMNASDASWFGLQSMTDLTWVAGTVSWDPSNQTMTFNPTGLLAVATTYRVYANATARDASDPGNAAGVDDTWTFTTGSTADLLPPSILNALAIPDPATVGQSVNVSADVTDDVALQDVRIVVTFGAAEVLNRTMISGAGSSWYDRNGYALPGLYAFVLTATDTSGNANYAGGSFTVIDVLPPTLANLLAVPDPAAVGQAVNVSVDVTDDVAVLTVGIVIALGPAEVLNRTMTPGTTPSWYDRSVHNTPGVYAVTLTATDTSGNAGGAVGSFTVVDVVAPTLVSAQAAPPIQGVGLAVNITAVATDDVAVQSVTVAITDPGGSPLGNFTMARLGLTDEYAFEQPYLTLGTYAFLVWATDAAGHDASSPGTFEIRDLEPPSILHTPPAAVLVGAPLRLAAQVSDDVGVVDVRADFTDVALNRFNVSLALNGSVYEIDIAGQATPGSVTYFLWAIDAAGNSARTADLAVAVVAPDTLPPTIANVLAVPSPQNIGGVVNITATVTDDVALAGVWIEVRAPGGALLANATAGYEAASGRHYHAGAYPQAGTHTFRISAVDSSGNWAAVSGSFVIADLEAPVATAGQDRTVWNGTVVFLDGSGSTDNVQVTAFTWTFTYRGAPVTLTSAVGSFRFDDAGTFAITLTVTDAAGLTDTDTLTVQVVRDTTPPPVPSGLVLVPGAADCLGLTWIPSSADDLAGYTVYRYNATSGRFDPVGTLGAAEVAFHDCGRVAGVRYLYWVVAFDANGTASAPSAVIGGAIPASPTTPTEPQPPPNLLLAVIVLAAGILAFAFWRRRKPVAEESPPPAAPPRAPEVSAPPPESPPEAVPDVWPPPPP